MDWSPDSYRDGFRFYDPAIARFTTVDPLADLYSFQTPYAYAANNPIRFIDFMGLGADDHYYNENGDYLYSDNLTTDNIKIIQSSDWESIKTEFGDKLNDRSQSSEYLMSTLDENSVMVNQANISTDAWAKITTSILAEMHDVNTSDLSGAQVSVYDAITGKSTGSPEKGSRDLANTSVKNDEINITVYLYRGAADTGLRTKANIQNALGAHEYLGHGIKGYGRKVDHSKAFETQMGHYSWSKTTSDFKTAVNTLYEEYKASGN